MSKWITEEANNHNDLMQQRLLEKQLIQNSNYWAKLVRMVQLDVAEINEHPYWKPILATVPLQFGEEPNGAGYQVSKSSYPQVTVRLRNEGHQILIERGFIDNEQIADKFSLTEALVISTMNRDVILRGENKQTFLTLEDATRHILRPIIETLEAAQESTI